MPKEQPWSILYRSAAMVLLGLILTAATVVATRWHAETEHRSEISHQADLLLAQSKAALAALVTPARILTSMEIISALVRQPTPNSVLAANQMLERAALTLAAEALYVMDGSGTTRAASNWRSDKSFVGKNYAFRPYFQQALSGQIGLYVAQGVTSDRLGLYVGLAIPSGDSAAVAGVMVLKYPAHVLLPSRLNHHVAVRHIMTDEKGIVFASSDPELQLATLGQLDPATRAAIADSRQYDLNSLSATGQAFSLLNKPDDQEQWIRWHPKSFSDTIWNGPTLNHDWLGQLLPLPRTDGWHVGVLLPNLIDDQEFLLHRLVPNILVAWLGYGMLLLGWLAIHQRQKHLAHLRLLMRRVPVAMALFDHRMNYLTASHRWLENHNIDTDDLAGRCHFDLCPDLSQRWRQIFDQCLEGQWQRQEREPFGSEEEDAEWFTWEAFPWRDKRGRVGGLLIFQENVTGQVRLEQNIRHHRDKLSYERGFIENIIVKMRASKRFNPEFLRFVMAPVEKTAGDMLLSALRPDGVQHVMLGDFTGHGLTAALGGPLVSDIFYAMTAKNIDLMDIIHEINQQLHVKMPIGLFMAACFVEVDRHQQQARLWNCGMPELLLFRRCQIIHRVPSGHMALGIRAQDSMAKATVVVNLIPEDRIIAFSDGVVEVCDPDGNLLGQESVEAVLTQVLEGRQELDILRNFLEAYRHHPEQADDITIVEIRY
ncbi:MAG: SpoIIE family protein phosphatase [Magnetococcales bacterium]|nr:SpoIIE family protein phosphatase [Magnetococcales bacterium]